MTPKGAQQMTALMEKRIAIIGSGDLAAAYRDALTDFPDLALDAVTDPNLCRAQPASERRPRLLRAADDLLRSTVPHLALICTPPARHLEEVSLLLRAGLDVLVESPLAGTRTDAEEITSLAERIGRVVMTAEKFRVFDAVLEARKRIDLGRVGRLVYVEVTRSSKLDVSRAQHGNPHAFGAGVWMAYGCDCLDLVEMLAGPLERIRMRRAEHLQGAGIEDEARVETDHGRGLMSRIDLSWNQEIPAPIARCVGERGEILIGWAQSVLRTETGKEIFAAGFDQREVCRTLLARFLRERRRPEPVEDRGGQTLAWIEAAHRSLRSRRWELA
jgi:predicted dehydrogenase